MEKTISKFNLAGKIVEHGYGNEFTISFIKSDGSTRTMRAVTPKASFNTETNEFKYEPTEKGLLSLIDLDLAKAKKNAFRMANIGRIFRITFKGDETPYKVV